MTVTASNFEPQRNQLYETPYWAVEILLKHLPPVAGRIIWEPAAGNHRIADILLIAGATVHTTDIEIYERQHNGIFDFINSPCDKLQIFGIITNPPYGPGNHTAPKFTRLALQRCDGWVAMLLTAKFDSGSTRVDLFRDNTRFHKKIVLIDRCKWFDGPGTSTGTEDHAWYIWRPVIYRNNGEAAPVRGTPPAIVYEGNQYK